MRIWFAVVSSLIALACLHTNLWSQSQLLDQFQSEGIQLSEGTSVKLNPPLLMGQPPQAQPLLEKLAQRHGWERFARNSPTAPVLVEISSVQDASEKRVGHNIYSAFVAYAPLAMLKDQDLMTSLFGTSSQEKELLGFDPEELPTDILERAGIKKSDKDYVRYSTLRIPLMNRVVIEGTARIEKIEKDGHVIIVWQLDPKFTMDTTQAESSGLAKYANRYQKVVRDELGKEVESPAVAYSGCGGYLSVSQTGLADQQLLIESRMAIHEPDEWFAGSNFLRSKFPVALQESAQSFRRKLILKK
jgi:hypothetical protein